MIGHIFKDCPNAALIVSNFGPLTGTPAVKWKASVKAYNALIPDVIAKYAAMGHKVYFLDMHGQLTSADISGDGVHPNQSGYNKMGDAWFDACKSTALMPNHCGVAKSPQPLRPVEHSQFMVYQTLNGQQRPVKTAEDWAIRRRQILKEMEMVMGKLPDRSKLPPSEVKAIDRVDGDGFVQLRITYLAEENDRVSAYLFLPKNGRTDNACR